jgi:DNA primase
MEDERVILQIGRTKYFSKSKNDDKSKCIETILTLRWYLVGKIEELKSSLSSEGNSDNTEPLSMVMDYNLLIHSFQNGELCRGTKRSLKFLLYLLNLPSW